jgi:hypothetical protein
MFDDDWDIYDKWNNSDRYSECSNEDSKPNKYCRHEWKPTVLIISTVYDCKKCGIKKEEYEKQCNDIPF